MNREPAAYERSLAGGESVRFNTKVVIITGTARDGATDLSFETM